MEDTSKLIFTSEENQGVSLSSVDHIGVSNPQGEYKWNYTH